jgi:DNA-binding PadR family transcriptional regulator
MVKKMTKIQYPRYIILGLLGIKPMSGYDIKKWVDVSFRYFWDIGYGQIYPTLKRLEAEDLVTMKNDQAEGGPVRNLYTITDEGKTELDTWLLAPEQKEYEILLKIYFGNALPTDIMKEKVRGFQKKREEELAEIEKTDSFLAGLPDTMTAKPFLRSVGLCGTMTYKAQIAWAEETLAILNSVNSTGKRKTTSRKGSAGSA